MARQEQMQQPMQQPQGQQPQDGVTESGKLEIKPHSPRTGNEGQESKGNGVRQGQVTESGTSRHLFAALAFLCIIVAWNANKLRGYLHNVELAAVADAHNVELAAVADALNRELLDTKKEMELLAAKLAEVTKNSNSLLMQHVAECTEVLFSNCPGVFLLWFALATTTLFVLLTLLFGIVSTSTLFIPLRLSLKLLWFNLKLSFKGLWMFKNLLFKAKAPTPANKAKAPTPANSSESEEVRVVEAPNTFEKRSASKLGAAPAAVGSDQRPYTKFTKAGLKAGLIGVSLGVVFTVGVVLIYTEGRFSLHGVTICTEVRAEEVQLIHQMHSIYVQSTISTLITSMTSMASGAQDEAKPKKKRGWKFWKKPAATSEQQPQQPQKLSDRELELSVELEQARQQIKALLQEQEQKGAEICSRLVEQIGAESRVSVELQESPSSPRSDAGTPAPLLA